MSSIQLRDAKWKLPLVANVDEDMNLRWMLLSGVTGDGNNVAQSMVPRKQDCSRLILRRIHHRRARKMSERSNREVCNPRRSPR